MALVGVDQVSAAEQELRKAIELAPDFLPARVALARQMLQQGRHDEVAAQVAAVHALEPEHPDVLMLEASLARLQGREDEALAKLERTHEVAPSQVTVRNLALEMVRRGERESGVKLLEDWLQSHPSDTPIRMTLADLYMESNQDERAREQYRAVLDVDERNIVALNNLAWGLRKREPKQALVYAERAWELAPDSADVLDTLALVLLDNKELSKARARIEEALKLAPDNPGIHYHAAMIMHAAGDTGGAVHLLEPLVNGGKDFPEKREATAFLASIKHD